MKVISLLATKGGAGKSLLTIHLACEAKHQGVETCIIDLDPQCSVTMFSDTRAADAPVVMSIQPQRLSRTLQAARDGGAELVFIDTAPHASSAAISTAELSDLVIIPCRPSIFDIKAIGDTAKIVQLAQTPAYVVLNAVPHNAAKIEQDARAAVQTYGLSSSSVVVHSWAALSRSLTSGKSVREFDPANGAVAEIERLCEWVGVSLNSQARPLAPMHERASV